MVTGEMSGGLSTEVTKSGRAVWLDINNNIDMHIGRTKTYFAVMQRCLRYQKESLANTLDEPGVVRDVETSPLHPLTNQH